MLETILLYGLLRIFFMSLVGRESIKKYPKYQYYTSITFQNLILPILLILYSYGRVKSEYIFLSCFSYFLTDIPELIYIKDTPLFMHHILSMALLVCAKYLHNSVHIYCILHLFILELGSSILSIPYVFKYDKLKKCRFPIFTISRILSLFTLYNIISSKNVENIAKLIILFFKIFVYFYNSQVIVILYNKR